VLALLLALACRPGDPPGGGVNPTTGSGHSASTDTGTPVELPTVWVEDFPTIPRIPGAFGWGGTLAAGMDLDHDGIQEFAVAGPLLGDDTTPVGVFEGTEQVAVRTSGNPSDPEFGYYLAAGGDTDGDGFGELLIAHGMVTEPSETLLLRSVHPADDIHLEAAPDRPWYAGAVTFVEGPGGHRVVTTSDRNATGLRYDLFDLSKLEPGATRLQAGDDTLLHTFGYEAGGAAFRIDAVDVDGDGQEEWLAGRTHHDVAESYACPATVGMNMAEDCTFFAGNRPQSVGAFHVAGDVVGDSAEELLLGGFYNPDNNGELAMLDGEGQVLARWEGTDEEPVGGLATPFTDKQGQRWLLRPMFRAGGPEVAVYAFRGSVVSSEMTRADASYVIRTQQGQAFGGLAVYQPAADAPLQLVISDWAQGDSGTVWLVDLPAEFHGP